MATGDLETRIAEVLAAHMPNGDAEWCLNETCFYEFGAEGFHEEMTFEEAFAKHQADMLAPILDEVKKVSDESLSMSNASGARWFRRCMEAREKIQGVRAVIEWVDNTPSDYIPHQVGKRLLEALGDTE